MRTSLTVKAAATESSADGVYAASRRIVGLGMGCERPGEIYERWRHAVDKPIDPVVVESGPVRRGSRRCGAGGNRTVDATGTGGGARLQR